MGTHSSNSIPFTIVKNSNKTYIWKCRKFFTENLGTTCHASVHLGDAQTLHIVSGWPRSGWPQVGHFDQKIKVNQIASYCAMLYPRCCSLWPCTFWGLHSSAFDSSSGQTRGSHFNFYWGTDTTMWSYAHFLCSCVTKIYFYHLLWNWQVKRLIKQHKKEIKNVSFCIWK